VGASQPVCSRQRADGHSEKDGTPDVMMERPETRVATKAQRQRAVLVMQPLQATLGEGGAAESRNTAGVHRGGAEITDEGRVPEGLRLPPIFGLRPSGMVQAGHSDRALNARLE